MFNGFPSTVTPLIQSWDFSKTPTTAAQTVQPSNQVALADDCAPTQIFYVGGSFYPVRVTLPVASAAGKIINIRVELAGSVVFFGNGVYVYDLLANSAQQLVVKIGTPGYMSFVSVEYAIKGGSTQSNYKWAVISGSTASSNTIGTNSGSGSAQFGENVVSASQAFAAGSGNVVSSSATYGIALGLGHTVSSLYAGAFAGNSNEVNASNATAIGGYYGTTNGIQNKAVFVGDSLGTFGGRGKIQVGLLSLAVQTTDATATALRSNTSAAGTGNQVVLPNNSAYYFRGECVAGVTGAGDTKGWYIEGVIKRGANAASTILVGTPSVTSLYADAGAATWSLAVTADTTNGALRITATGQLATTIRWVANIKSTEVAF